MRYGWMSLAILVVCALPACGSDPHARVPGQLKTVVRCWFHLCLGRQLARRSRSRRQSLLPVRCFISTCGS
jgi:hypothetical protein